MANPQQITDPHQLITRQDVEQALKVDKGLDATLESFEIKDFTTKGDNFATLVTSVEVQYRKAGRAQEVSYVAKLNPCRPALPILGDMMNKIFAKEIMFYSQVVPLLNKELLQAGEGRLCFPKYFHSEETKDQQVIYFEDLRRTGFKMYNRQLAMDEEHIELIIKELARLNASSALLQASHGNDWTDKFAIFRDEYDFYKAMDDSMIGTLFGTSLESTALLTDQISGYEFVSEFLRKMKPELKSIFADLLSAKEPFNLITHGDLWNGNFLFRYSAGGVPQECRLLDLQIVRVSSPAVDLNQVIFPNLESQLRRTHLSKFLTSYYVKFASVLAGTGVPMRFTLPELRKEFASKHMYGLIFGTMIVMTVLLDPEDLPDVDFFFKGDAEGALDRHREVVNKFLLKSPSLRPRLLDLFDDMKEYGVFAPSEVSQLVHSFNKRASLKK